ncbi:WAS/WASL-interacting protein family member 1-like [Panicum virgatum]|uniref:Uncharacterized protein n=1 Tax=Panicum virgatum TaxID=38727 RepID=A0A8T0NIU3_PANVG|nr:WAS/WASL-interacting protein family member 1-like [Panicum virgatum]KAG2549891.1 hypothetical protein PVAP13_9KG273500 [Panicum virgatum]
MDNVLIDRSASGFDFRRRTDAIDDGCRRGIAMSALPPRTSSSIYTSFPYVSQLPPFQYTPYLHSSLSLPPLPPRRPALGPLPPAMATTMAKHAAPPHRTAAASTGKPAVPRRTGLGGEYKRKKPRAPRPGEEPLRAQRRKPLERATPLPPAPAVDEALDDLEREVTRGFVEDLMHTLAPPPSSLPLPTFSLVRAAAVKSATASCAV